MRSEAPERVSLSNRVAWRKKVLNDSTRMDHAGYQYQEDQEIWWLTKPTGLTRERTEFLAYGNEAQLALTLLLADSTPYSVYQRVRFFQLQFAN